MSGILDDDKFIIITFPTIVRLLSTSSLFACLRSACLSSDCLDSIAASRFYSHNGKMVLPVQLTVSRHSIMIECHSIRQHIMNLLFHIVVPDAEAKAGVFTVTC